MIIVVTCNSSNIGSYRVMRFNSFIFIAIIMIVVMDIPMIKLNSIIPVILLLSNLVMI